MTTIIRDIAGLLGCGLVSIGVGMIFLPAGVITAGLLLVAGAVLSGRAG
jgi:hypothetical protein